MIGVVTRTPTDQDLQNFPHIILSSEQEWYPQNFHFPKSSRTLEEGISSTVRDIKTQGEFLDFVGKHENGPVIKSLYDTGTLSHRFISSVNVQSISIKVSQVGIEFQDVTQSKTSQSKWYHLCVSPEDFSEKYQIGIEQEKETLNRTTQRLI